MAETEVKSINGRPVADVTARAKIEEIKNAAPGLVFDTVADMEAYVAANAGTLKVGQDLFIRAADVPDYWWDGTQAVPVETDLTEVRNELDQLSAAIDEQGKTIPKVFDWANAELPFTENEISGVASGGGFVVNPTNFADGKTYFRYNAGASDGFRWTNPNPQKGSLTITMRGYSQYSETLRTKIVTVYTDGTDNSLTDIMYLTHGNTVTYTTDPYKTVDYIRGNYDFEDWVLLDMDVLSVVADYPAPTGTVKSVNGNLPDENGNVQITIPSGGGSGGTDITLGISGATVGQTVKITGVDENGKPTKWEAVDMASGGASSWNDLTDKPFGSGIGKLDIIPEQQVTFSGGVAQLTSWKDPCYDLGLVSNPGTMTAILDINGEIIESELKYNYVASGTFGAYAVQLGAGTIKLGDGATVSDGETATVRMYVMSEIVETLDPKFLPENAAMAVSYSRNQTLTESEQTIVRSNIGAKQTFIWSVLGGGLSTFITTEGFVTEYKEKINILACDFIAVKMNLCTDTSTNKICSADIFVRIEVEVPMCASAMFYTGSEFIEAKFKISISKENRTITIKLLQDIEGYRIQFDGLDLVIFETSY